jgi:hypothetical protein
MKVYLAKFTIGEKSAYKIGYTKWFIAEKRFADEQYCVFDKIEILDTIYITHPDIKKAKGYTEFIEGFLKSVFKKNFRLETYFDKQYDFFTGLSGITEMFILEEGMTEHYVVKVFRNVKNFAEIQFDKVTLHD